MAMDQHYLVFPSQFVAGQQSILCRTPHIQAGDDVKDFRQFMGFEKLLGRVTLNF